MDDGDRHDRAHPGAQPGWWIGGEPRYLGMAINSIGVLYLNQRDVRIIFEEPEEPEP